MSANSTSLYSTSTSNITLSSNNLTTLYPGGSGTVTPAQPYGNANVVGLLAVGTDGANTVANIIATGNITGNYFLGNGSQLTGVVAVSANTANTAVTVTGNAQPNITSVGTLTSLSSTGNVTGGNLRTAGAVSATGNVTGNYFLGNGSQLTGLPATYSNANVVTLLANFGSNSISTTGNITAGNVFVPGVVSATGNISTQGYFIGNFQGNISGNITVPGSNTQVLYNNNGNAGASSGFTFNQASNVVTVAGNIVAGNISTVGNVTANYVIGNGSLLTSITGANVTGSVAQANQANTANSVAGANVSGQVANALVAGTVYTAAQPNITSVGTLTSVAVTGNTTTGNLLTGGVVSATGNVTGNYLLGNGAFISGLPAGYSNADVATFLANFGSNSISTTGNVTASYLVGNGSGLTAITGANVTGTVANATFATTAGSAGTANTAVTVTGNAQANITSLGILTSLSVSGNTTSGNVLTSVVQATGSGGLSLKNSGGTTQASMGAGGGDNFAINVSTNLNGNNAQIDISPTGTGHVHIKPTGTGAVEIAPTSTGSINNMIIGNITPAAVSATTVSATGNITGNYFIGNGSQLTGLPAGYSNADVATFLANFGSNSISTTGNVTAGYFAGNGSLLSSITGANVTGTVANATYALNANAATYANVVTDNAQPNITSVGTLTSVSVSGNATVGNLLTGGIVSAAGNITGNYFIGNGSQLTGITANAAGSNTQIQYNNGNAFAGNAGLTFNQTTGNVALANLVVSPGVAGNAVAGNNAVIINTATPYNGILATATGLQAGQTVYGTGNYGNLAVAGLLFSTPKGARNLFWDSANVSDGSNVGVRYVGLAVPSTVTLQGNLTSNNTFLRAFFSGLQVGGGSAANTFTNASQGGQALGAAAFTTTIGEGPGTVTPRVGNTTVQDTVSLNSQVTVWNGSNVGNAVSAVYNFTNSTGNITNALGVITQFSGTVNTTPTNVVGYYMPTNTGSLAGFNSANAMRAATNYYFLKNDDAVAQTQLGSLRSYNEYRYDTATTGSIAIDKTNAQVQYIAPTGNVTITGYNNMVTTLSDSVNTDQEIDTLTVLVQQGATPYTVTLPTGATYQYAGNISTVPAVANSRSILTVVAANVAGTVNYFTTVQSDQAVVSSYGDANVTTFLAAFGSNTISTTGTVTAGNVTGGNILTGGIMSATGNVTGNYFLGNGSQLTGITASSNAAGANTQIQYNNANAFAGSAYMTFDNLSSNVTLSNVIIGLGNGTAAGGGLAQRINTSDAFVGIGTNVSSYLSGQIVIGNGYFGNLNHNNSQIAAVRAGKVNIWDSANLAEVSNVGFRYNGLTILPQISISNVANTNTVVRGGVGALCIGGGASANIWSQTSAGPGAVIGFNQALVVGQPNTVIALGNVTLQGASASYGQIIVNNGSNVGNAVAVYAQINNSGNVTTALGMSVQFTGTANVTPTNVFGFYMPNTTTTYGFASSNSQRAATNYYFLRNDDAVAQSQLGSLRAYHTFQATGNTTGTWNIDKSNGQVQAVSATGNITIGSYTNFVTTANDGTNNDSQTDTVTLIIEQGATPYTVTMPTGNAAIRYASNVTTVANTANSTTMIAITAYRTAANATGYLTTISPGFV